VFTKNRERLLAGDIAVEFLLAVIGDRRSSGGSRPGTSRWTAR
jgi:hypothetical protein